MHRIDERVPESHDAVWPSAAAAYRRLRKQNLRVRLAETSPLYSDHENLITKTSFNAITGTSLLERELAYRTESVCCGVKPAPWVR